MEPKTIFITAQKIDDKSFYIDVLYYNNTSYSKSLYPTLSRYFNKYAKEFFKLDIALLIGSMQFENQEENIYTGDNRYYFIKRVIYTLK